MKLYRNVGLNFVGNAWNGVLIVLTTPWYISMLGMEGFGLVGFWQLLLYIFLIFDFGLGPSLVREFAAYRGAGRGGTCYRSLLLSVEKVCMSIAVAIALVVFFAATWIASSWLSLEQFAIEEVELAIRFMALSIASQLLNSVYANGLLGLQRHGVMNILQMLGYGLRYFGGGLVLFSGVGISFFFAYQGISMLAMACITRLVLLKGIGEDSNSAESGVSAGLQQLAKYSAGMFITALLGMLLSNADRIILSKLLSTADLGRYTLALAAAGFLQMIVFAFYRSYFPVFAEQRVKGDIELLKSTYYEGCSLVGTVVVPAAVIGWVFSGELIFVWIGRSDPLASQIFRYLVLGTASAGLMWLPAAYQQASGWTILHTSLMALSLALGVPCALIAVNQFGAVGGTSLMLVHGLVEITFGLWLMNRVMFHGENLKWYRRVLMLPLLVSLPFVALSRIGMPETLNRLGLVLWIGATGLLLLACLFGVHKKLSLTKN